MESIMPSVDIAVGGSSSTIRLNMSHNSIGNKGGRRGTFLRKEPK